MNCTTDQKERVEQMAISGSNREIWEEIERSESYLVSCMYEEAASRASSVLRDLCCSKFTEAGEETLLNDMFESAGMVLVQSLKELGRTRDIFNELLLLFGSVIVIPFQVFLAGQLSQQDLDMSAKMRRVCFQISEGPCPGTKELLEEFLSKWILMDEGYYVLASAESNVGYMGGSGGSFYLGVDKYLEVVEVYVVTLLGMVLRDVDHAFSWVEKAALPEEKRQELLRKLQSLFSPKAPGPSSQDSVVTLPAECEARSSSLKEQNSSEGSPEALKAPFLIKRENDMKQKILKLSQQRVPCFWWFRTFTLRFGNRQLVISNTKLAVGCLMILLYYIFWRKQATLKRILKRRTLSVKKALVDLWQLAFSYQVNPLAAVQPIPATTHGTH